MTSAARLSGMSLRNMDYTPENPIPPGSEIRLIKLWPHARKQGHENGEVWKIGLYSKQDGLDVIWLVNGNDEYKWTIDHEFLKKHFEVIACVKCRKFFG